jgi:hypothetical protein
LGLGEEAFGDEAEAEGEGGAAWSPSGVVVTLGSFTANPPRIIESSCNIDEPYMEDIK